MTDETQRDLGRLEARVAGLEDWTKALSQKLDEMSHMLANIDRELAATKGASRVVTDRTRSEV